MKGFLRIIFFSFLFSFFLFGLTGFVFAKRCNSDAECSPHRCIDNRCVRALEVEYPALPGEPNPPVTTGFGLPAYVNYLFKFSFWIIGVIIFGVLVYNGVKYLGSVGEPTKYKEATEGILYAFLGALILLGSYLIFNTINPQLLTLDINKLPVLQPFIPPGIYVCNYNDSANIMNILSDYFSGDLDKRIKAVEKIREKMASASGKKVCMHLNYSGKFRDFYFENGDTWFVIPKESPEYDPSSQKMINKYLNEFGVIMHEGDDFSGGCKLLFPPDFFIYNTPNVSTLVGEANFSDFSNPKAKSFTLFKKPSAEPSQVTLYQCYQYNEISCKEKPSSGGTSFLNVFASNTSNWASLTFNFTHDIEKITQSNLGDLNDNVRSIKFEPENTSLAVMFENDEFKGKCEVISQNTIDLTKHPIGRCGAGCNELLNVLIQVSTLGIYNPECKPCISSIYLIKGQRL